MTSLSIRKVFSLLGAGIALAALTALCAAQTKPAPPLEDHARGVVQSLDAKAKTFVLVPGPGMRGHPHQQGAPEGTPEGGNAGPGVSAEMAPAPARLLTVNAFGAKILIEKEGAPADCAVGKWARIEQHPSREGGETAAAMVTLLAAAPPAWQQPKGEGWGPQAGPQGNGPGPRGKGFRGGEVGQIIKLNPFTIKLQDGREKQVTLSDRTRYMKTLAGSFSDLGEDKLVMVTGKRLKDGTLSATQVVVQASRPLPGGGGFGPRGGGQVPPPPVE
jgi:hypothetical protein